jgi:quercetin dioxygenase-like cupin family protein
MTSRSHLRRLPVLLPVALALVLAGAVAGWALATSRSAPTAKRFALAQAKDVRGAPDRTLGLARVIIPPGGKIALHHHQGTQAAYIASGVLTYTVHTGHVRVRSGLADQHPTIVKTISAGETGRIHPGQWIVEQPNVHHSAANHGDKRIVIYLSTLLRHGAPPSTPG